MREIHAPIDGDGFAAPDSPRSAGEVAKAIDRNDDGVSKRRNMERRGKMGEVMLDPMHLATEVLTGKIRGQQIGDALASSPVLESVENEREVRTPGHHIGDLSEEI